MADMMAKALEEQAAMQAEMDRQMASLDVRLSRYPGDSPGRCFLLYIFTSSMPPVS